MQGVSGKLIILRKKFRNFMNSASTENFFIICVIVNSVCLALEGIINEEIIQHGNLVFNILFFIEMIYK